jgi:hypothetical protein
MQSRILNVMPKSSSRLGIPLAFLTLFQLLIILNGMPGKQTRPITITGYNTRAHDRALRVGIGEHCGHDISLNKVSQITYLQIWNAQSSVGFGHDNRPDRCQTKRNLFKCGAIQAGAAVPRVIFTTLRLKFSDTLTLPPSVLGSAS